MHRDRHHSNTATMDRLHRSSNSNSNKGLGQVSRHNVVGKTSS
jgi:hypothetical protein